MAEYQRETRVRAPLADVWEFHSTVDGLVALTPDWMNLRVESIVGPAGERGSDALENGSARASGRRSATSDVLEAGTEIGLSVRPFGVGPRRRWTSRIVERSRGDGAASFRDEMIDGPFDRWVHTHSFFADGRETKIRDRVEYEFPAGPVGDAIDPLAVVGFEPTFRHRHRRTRELLEDR